MERFAKGGDFCPNEACPGTIFYRKRTPEHEILETLALLAEGNRPSSLSRVKGFKENTILAWLREAARHAEAVEEVLMAKFKVKRGQLDALWAYVGNKGERSYPETKEIGRCFVEVAPFSSAWYHSLAQ